MTQHPIIAATTAPHLKKEERLEREYKRLLGGEVMSLRELLTAIVESGDGVVLADKDGKIRYVNLAYELMTGYAESELIGNTPSIVSSGLYSKKFYESMWAELLAGNVFRTEFINRRKSGELYYQLETITPVKDATGLFSGFVSNGRDVTKERYQEKKLALMGKMSSLFLAQFRDPLRRIQSAAMRLRGFAEKKEGKEEKALEDLSEIYTTSKEVEQMLDALHEFLDPSFAKDSSADIQEIVKRAIDMVNQPLAEHHASFSTHFEDPLPHLKINERLWQFVLAELFHHYGAIALGETRAAATVRINVRSFDQNLVITIEGGKGEIFNNRAACTNTCGCVWVDGTDFKFILMELVIGDAGGIVHYETIDDTVRTTLVIPHSTLPPDTTL